MTVRRHISAAFALCALLFGAGCSDRDSLPTLAETDEPFYVQGMTLKRQGRYPEALTAFLKVIDKRGAPRSAPESHLEAGALFLNHIKDPVYAYYHFRRYLDLQPNSKQAEFVLGQVKAAQREFARTLPGRPMEDQSVRMQTDEEISKLRRENAELRAELATLRGGGAMPVSRSPRMITVPDETVSMPKPAPAPAEAVVETPVAPAPKRTPPTPSPAIQTPTPPAAATAKPGTTAARPTAPGGRTYVVAAKDTIFGISVKFYGNGKQVDAIYQANRDVMQHKTDLRPGMVLKIPPADGASPTRR